MKFIFLRYSCALLAVLGNEVFAFVFLPLTVYSSFFLLNLFGEASLYGEAIQLPAVSFVFIPACAATLAYVLLLVLILFTRDISLKQGLKMFFLGSLMIFTLNMVRILFLVYVYINYGKNYFDFIHLFLWHFVSSIFVVGVWIFLVEYYKIKAIPLLSDIKEILK